jgi:uncharacterized protein (UPF0216 family)
MCVNTVTDPLSRVHSQLCENVLGESCTLMEEEDIYIYKVSVNAFQIYLTNHCFCFVLRLFLLNTGSKIFCYTGRSLYSARISLAKYCLRYRCFFENKLCWFIIVTMRCHTDETFRKHGASQLCENVLGESCTLMEEEDIYIYKVSVNLITTGS